MCIRDSHIGVSGAGQADIAGRVSIAALIRFSGAGQADIAGRVSRLGAAGSSAIADALRRGRGAACEERLGRGAARGGRGSV